MTIKPNGGPMVPSSVSVAIGGAKPLGTKLVFDGK